MTCPLVGEVSWRSRWWEEQTHETGWFSSPIFKLYLGRGLDPSVFATTAGDGAYHAFQSITPAPCGPRPCIIPLRLRPLPLISRLSVLDSRTWTLWEQDEELWLEEEGRKPGDRRRCQRLGQSRLELALLHSRMLGPSSILRPQLSDSSA